MKKFEMLGRILSKTEQKKIKGGVVYGGCTCVGSTGVWTYTQRTPTCHEQYEDKITYCRSGEASCWGSCVNLA